MLQKVDLAAIAEQIESPYHPIPLLRMDALEISLFICQGSRSWHRQLSHEHMLFVIEGVITIDSAASKTIVSEGEMVTIPRDVGYNSYSGMRSTVMSIESVGSGGRFNGHETPPAGPRGVVAKTSAAIAVKRASEFDWLACGTAGAYSAVGTRLLGSSGPYVAPRGSLILTVYRGVLDYRADAEQGTAVGSQMLVVPAGSELALRSEHGATVIAVGRKGIPLPAPSTTGSGASEAPPPSTTEPGD